MEISGPLQNVRHECERILRSLPAWFGIESALLDYAQATERLPTFCAFAEGALIGFISLECLDANEWEVHCIAVREGRRDGGVGTALLNIAEAWARSQGARSLIVKTLADSHPSLAYKASRAFYLSKGFAAEKIIPDIWGPSNPCLQMRKELAPG
ncbi:MAG: GNAT family N-acetyltransferase [Rhodocyclaceae bacterium]